MKIYEELKEIAELNARVIELANQMEEKEIDLEELHLERAELIKGCVAENGHLYSKDGVKLDNCGIVDEEYYCCQHKGIIEDDFYGTVYYATDEEGTFVAIPFSTY